MFSFESRRARASISLDCETGLTSCIILTRWVFTARVLKRKKKKRKIKEDQCIEWLIHEWTNLSFVKRRLFSTIHHRVAEFELYLIFYLWASIIKISISYQVSIIFKMRGVIQFTDIIDSSSLWLFFEVSTDAVVVHVAEKLTVIQVFDVFGFDFMAYQTFFSKEEVIWKQHCAISLWNRAIIISEQFFL